MSYENELSEYDYRDLEESYKEMMKDLKCIRFNDTVFMNIDCMPEYFSGAMDSSRLTDKHKAKAEKLLENIHIAINNYKENIYKSVSEIDYFCVKLSSDIRELMCKGVNEEIFSQMKPKYDKLSDNYTNMDNKYMVEIGYVEEYYERYVQVYYGKYSIVSLVNVLKERVNTLGTIDIAKVHLLKSRFTKFLTTGFDIFLDIEDDGIIDAINNIFDDNILTSDKNGKECKRLIESINKVYEDYKESIKPCGLLE